LKIENHFIANYTAMKCDEIDEISETFCTFAP